MTGLAKPPARRSGHSGTVAARAPEGVDLTNAADGRSREAVPVRERVRTTSVAWYGHAELTREEWATYGLRLGAVTRSSRWWLGDWVRFGQHRYTNGRFAVASRISGYDEQTLRNFGYVAGRYEVSRRRENLTWSHHAELAALVSVEQDWWLDEAAARNLSVRRLRDAVRDRHRAQLAAATVVNTEDRTPRSSTVLS